MPRKISHVVIGLIVLVFCIGGFTALINFGDSGAGVDSSFIKQSLNTFENNVSSNDLQYELVQRLDNTSNLEPDTASQVENRGSSSFGIMNLLSKNILTGFITEVGRILGVPELVIYFFISIVTSTIIILFIRAYWGSDRV